MWSYRGKIANEALRIYLKQHLPEYMLPAAFVVLEKMPLTHNGKLDRKALPAPEFKASHAYVAPRNETEHKLCHAFQEVLRLEQVGIMDNFFELGGDSIISIQLVSRLRRQQLSCQIRDVFEHPTVAELAKNLIVLTEQEKIPADFTGKLSLTAIQQAFFAANLPKPNHYNQSLMLHLNPGFDIEGIKAALAATLAAHPLLSASFVQSDGEISESYGKMKALDEILLEESLPQNDQEAWINEQANRVQQSLNFEGRLIKVLLITGFADRSARLLWVIHHLVVDGVSWRILMEDFNEAYRLHQQHEPVSIALEANSFKDWSQRLSAYTQTLDPSYWRALPSPKPLTIDAGLSKQSGSGAENLTLNKDLTQALLQEINRVYRTEINDLLLAALALALNQWQGKKDLSLTLEGHGREPLFP